MRRSLPCAVALLAFPIPVLAQQAPVTVWGDFGAGPGWLAGRTDIGLHFGLAAQTGPHLFAFRTTATADVLRAILDAIGGGSGTTAASDIGILYGRATTPDRTHIGVAAGLGVATIDRDSAGTVRQQHRITVPLEVQAAWRPTSVIGLAVIAFGSVNTARSFGGLTLAIELGRLR